jgi:hypothetical protein
VPVDGGAGSGVVVVDIEIGNGVPTALDVQEHEPRADVIFYTGYSLFSEQVTQTLNLCNDTGTFVETNEGWHHTFFAPALIWSDVVQAGSTPAVSIALVGCDEAEVCTYHATFDRSYTQIAADGSWNGASNVSFETDIVVSPGTAGGDDSG